jgi:hypothetical protein
MMICTGHDYSNPAVENELAASLIQIEATPGRKAHVVSVFVDLDGTGELAHASSQGWTPMECEAVATALEIEAARIRVSVRDQSKPS